MRAGEDGGHVESEDLSSSPLQPSNESLPSTPPCQRSSVAVESGKSNQDRRGEVVRRLQSLALDIVEQLAAAYATDKDDENTAEDAADGDAQSQPNEEPPPRKPKRRKGPRPKPPHLLVRVAKPRLRRRGSGDADEDQEPSDGEEVGGRDMRTIVVPRRVGQRELGESILLRLLISR